MENMRSIIFLFLACFIGLSFFYNPAFSQRHSGYCDRAESTAAALECVNRHNKDAQQALNDVYKGLFATQKEAGEKNASLLGKAQKDWIAYRNAQCSWEASLAPSDSLTRIYELSCLTAMTELRTRWLSSVKGLEEKKAPPEFSTSPRWMNVLTLENPDIYWHFGDWIRADLDCDGQDENIMTGLRLRPQVKADDGDKAVSDHTEQESTASLYTTEMVVAVAENPVTGKPAVTLISTPVDEKRNDGTAFCSPDVSMAISGFPASADEEDLTETAADDKSAKSCRTSIQLTHRSCKPLYLFWTGKAYTLSAVLPGDN